jgi:nicotinamide riboside kinase
MDVDTPWVDDPARDSADARAALFASFRRGLQEFEAKYVTISGPWKRRKEGAIAAIDRYAAR